MDTQTRHTLKNDKFAQAAATSASWLGEHKSNLGRWAIGAGVVLVLVIGGLTYRSFRTKAANTALGAAMDLYTTPLALPGAPAESGMYTTTIARATEANREFVAITHDYGWLPAGTQAHYFAGITYEELGQYGNAEKELKSAASAWNHNLANLAKLALAGLYHQTNRDSEAVDIYKEIVSKPSATVSANVAQLDLADLYAAQGKMDQARTLWAKVKDADKDGAAGAIADQKLSAKQ